MSKNGQFLPKTGTTWTKKWHQVGLNCRLESFPPAKPHRMSTSTISKRRGALVWRVWSPKRRKIPSCTSNYWIFLFPRTQNAFPCTQNIQTIAHISRCPAPIYNLFHRCVPLYDAVMCICLMSRVTHRLHCSMASRRNVSFLAGPSSYELMMFHLIPNEMIFEAFRLCST